MKVREWWYLLQFSSYAGFSLVKKLQGLQARIKEWNKQEFGCLDDRRNILERELED